MVSASSIQESAKERAYEEYNALNEYSQVLIRSKTESFPEFKKRKFPRTESIKIAHYSPAHSSPAHSPPKPRENLYVPNLSNMRLFAHEFETSRSLSQADEQVNELAQIILELKKKLWLIINAIENSQKSQLKANTNHENLSAEISPEIRRFIWKSNPNLRTGRIQKPQNLKQIQREHHKLGSSDQGEIIPDERREQRSGDDKEQKWINQHGSSFQ